MIDYASLPPGPQALYGMFPNGLPEGWSWEEYYRAHPTNYNPEGMNGEQRLRAWIEAGRPGWDSQGRILGTTGDILDDFSASLTGNIPSRIGGQPQVNSYPVSSNPLARRRDQNTWGIGTGQYTPPTIPSNTSGWNGVTVPSHGLNPGSTVHTPPPSTAPQAGAPPAFGRQPGQVPTLQQQATNPAAGNSSTFSMTPQPDLNVLSQNLGNRPGASSPFARQTRTPSFGGNRSPRGYQGYR